MVLKGKGVDCGLVHINIGRLIHDTRACIVVLRLKRLYDVIQLRLDHAYIIYVKFMSCGLVLVQHVPLRGHATNRTAL